MTLILPVSDTLFHKSINAYNKYTLFAHVRFNGGMEDNKHLLDKL